MFLSKYTADILSLNAEGAPRHLCIWPMWSTDEVTYQVHNPQPRPHSRPFAGHVLRKGGRPRGDLPRSRHQQLTHTHARSRGHRRGLIDAGFKVGAGAFTFRRRFFLLFSCRVARSLSMVGAARCHASAFGMVYWEKRWNMLDTGGGGGLPPGV